MPDTDSSKHIEKTPSVQSKRSDQEAAGMTPIVARGFLFSGGSHQLTAIFWLRIGHNGLLSVVAPCLFHPHLYGESQNFIASLLMNIENGKKGAKG